VSARRAALTAAIGVGVLVLAGCTRDVQVPDVRDMTVAESAAILEEHGFETVVIGDHDVDDVADWTVTSHSRRGEQHPPGSTVRLNAKSVLDAASDACDAGRIGDAGRSLVLDMQGDDWGSGDLTVDEVMCVLEHLDVPDVTLDRMGATRSLDGRQEDDWNGIEASWTYHPDNGLDVILELE